MAGSLQGSARLEVGGRQHLQASRRVHTRRQACQQSEPRVHQACEQGGHLPKEKVRHMLLRDRVSLSVIWLSTSCRRERLHLIASSNIFHITVPQEPDLPSQTVH